MSNDDGHTINLGVDLHATTDAAVWARAFAEVAVPRCSDPFDPTPGGLLHSWLANAIETGRSFGYSDGRQDGYTAGYGDGQAAAAKDSTLAAAYAGESPAEIALRRYEMEARERALEHAIRSAGPMDSDEAILRRAKAFAAWLTHGTVPPE